WALEKNMTSTFKHMLSKKTAQALSIGVTLFVVVLAIAAPISSAAPDSVSISTASSDAGAASTKSTKSANTDSDTSSQPTVIKSSGGASGTKEEPQNAVCPTPTTDAEMRAIREKVKIVNWNL